MHAPVRYTYDWYADMLDDLLAAGYEFRGYEAPVPERSVVLRHDVDWSPAKARRMARIEADRDVRATYFVLVSSPLYNVVSTEVREALEDIEAMGHDVGLHFSTHEYWTDDPGSDDVERRVREERRVLETVVDPVDVVSFHRPPDWTLGATFPFPNAYAPAFFEDVVYRADSTGRWRDEPPFPGDTLPDRVQVLAHPGLWDETDDSFTARLHAQRERHFDRVRQYLAVEYLP